jgi:hypothetical protein
VRMNITFHHHVGEKPPHCKKTIDHLVRHVKAIITMLEHGRVSRLVVDEEAFVYPCWRSVLRTAEAVG